MMCLASMYEPPLVSGVMRARSEDFGVQELPLTEFTRQGEHVYLHLRKRDTNTQWLAGQIADYCGVATMDVGYAGRKDRYAVTEQWFSCYLPKSDPDWDSMHIEGAELLATTRHSRKLRPGDLAGNRFDIQIRDLDPSSSQALLMDRMEMIKENGFPNYYGPQRFGHDNLAQAAEFIQGRNKKNRGMMISTIRSHLFNGYLSNCLAGKTVPEFGPLYGRSRDPQAGEENMSAEETAFVAGLRRLKVKVGERRMIEKPGSFDWQFNEEGLNLTFTLAPGCYATSMIGEILNYVDAGAPVE